MSVGKSVFNPSPASARIFSARLPAPCASPAASAASRCPAIMLPANPAANARCANAGAPPAAKAEIMAGVLKPLPKSPAALPTPVTISAAVGPKPSALAVSCGVISGEFSSGSLSAKPSAREGSVSGFNRETKSAAPSLNFASPRLAEAHLPSLRAADCAFTKSTCRNARSMSASPGGASPVMRITRPSGCSIVKVGILPRNLIFARGRRVLGRRGGRRRIRDSHQTLQHCRFGNWLLRPASLIRNP